MKFDQKIRKIMTFSAEDQARLAERKLRFCLKEIDMDEKTDRCRHRHGCRA